MISKSNQYNWKLLNDKKWSIDDIENFTLMFDKYHINENFRESLYNIIEYNLPFKKN